MPGRGTLDKAPILGLIQRGGQVILHRLANVQQKTIKPITTAAVAQGTLVHTDAYNIYAPAGLRLQAQDALSRARRVRPRRRRGRLLRGPRQHDRGVLVAPMRLAVSHRGISQDKLPLYLGFFQFVHNPRRRGKALLGALIAALVR